MTLEDELDNAKRMAEIDVNNLFHSIFQNSKSLNGAKLESAVLETKARIGVRVLVDKEAEQQDLPLLQNYADEFVVKFLGYLRTGVLQDTRPVNLLMARKSDKTARHIFNYGYIVEHTGPGNFQVRRGDLIFPIVRRYVHHQPHHDHAPTVAYVPSAQFSSVPYDARRREGILKVITVAVRDLFRAIRSY